MSASKRAFLKVAGWIAVPLTVALLLLSVLCSYAPDMFFLLILLLAVIGTMLAGAGFLALVLAVKDRRWRGILAVLSGLAVTALMASPVWMAGDYIHFVVSYALNSDVFARTDNHPVSIPWSSNGFAGSSCDSYLVYDRSARRGRDSGPGVITRHLSGGFFVRADCR